MVENARKIHDLRRQYGYLQHKLDAIIVIAFCAIVCGAEAFEDIEGFGKARVEWLSKFVEIQNGIPAKDTFRRVFERLNPSEVAECLYSWLGNRDSTGKTVNIDGKTICVSRNPAHKVYHVVSAWVSENQIILGEIVADEKSNEITAIPKLLDLVDVEGSVVTIDAMGTQTKIAEKSIEKQAVPNRVNTAEKGHGKIETREYFLETDIDWLTQKDTWKGLSAIGAVRSTVIENEQTRIATRYFLTSLTGVERFADSEPVLIGKEALLFLL